METIGSLCDKLTVVKLKQQHTNEKKRLYSLANQEKLLIDEIDEYIENAFSGKIEKNKLSFSSNKIFKEDSIRVKSIEGSFGRVISELAKTNCDIWHLQEKIYDFKKVPIEEKDLVIEKIAILNIDRNNCIDKLDKLLIKACESR
jgi:hypothetical protein